MKVYEGIVANTGKCFGRIKKIISVKDVKRVNDGDIIITKNNSPLFSLGFMKAGAIISESGGTLCHLAIISRELDKPCILSVENALDLFKEGMLVEVDAFKNKIRIIEDE